MYSARSANAAWNVSPARQLHSLQDGTRKRSQSVRQDARDITYNDVTETFHFRRITGDEADGLNLFLVGDDGKMDTAKLKGNISRQIAISLCDESGNAVATPEEIGTLDAALRARFHDVYKDLNEAPGEKKDQPAES